MAGSPVVQALGTDGFSHVRPDEVAPTDLAVLANLMIGCRYGLAAHSPGRIAPVASLGALPAPRTSTILPIASVAEGRIP